MLEADHRHQVSVFESFIQILWLPKPVDMKLAEFCCSAREHDFEAEV
jgi:hypothetical protein